MERLILQADTLIGDGLMMTPAIRAYKQAYPETEIHFWAPGNDQGAHIVGNEVIFQDNPYLSGIWRGSEFQPEPDDRVVNLSCSDAFQWGVQHRRTLAEGYGPQLGVNVVDISYDYVVGDEEAELAEQLALDLMGDKPFVIIARHSASCSSNDERCGYQANKCLSNRLWVQVAEWLIDQGFVPVAVGAKREESDSRYAEFPGKRLYGAPIRVVAALTRIAAGTLSVDTGIRHLCSAVGGHLGCLSGAIPLQLIRCAPVREHQRIHEIHCPVGLVSRRMLVEMAKRVLFG